MATKSLAMASWTTASLAIASLDSQLLGKIPFSLQNPNFESPTPKFVPKVCPNRPQEFEVLVRSKGVEYEADEKYRDLSFVSELTPDGVKLEMLKLTSNILEEIKNGQKDDLGLVDHVVLVNQGKGVDFRLDENGVLMFRDQVCVPDILELKKRILEEDHRSSLSIHLGATKMYQDLKRLF
ncbi:hypothetical protein MTR_0205s0020 [Medicago truncatula]|uniref:Uncharacterized protein n=1 Tax=Medicago truncatula TaxID=3880 RepID=A0A072THG1_MEDTR|nr:hypothetical protein MTR_0205s0020 [Medicago truncatula]